MQLKTLSVFVLSAITALASAAAEPVSVEPLAVVAPAPAPVSRRHHYGHCFEGCEDDIENVPYTVSIQWQNFHFAVGTIVDCSTIVTSAHAVKNVQTDDIPQYSIRAGSSNSRFGGQIIKIASVHRHPRYVAYPTPRADIAILKLATPLKFECGVQAAYLPHCDFYIGRSIWTKTSGWGFLNFDQSPAGNIQTATVPLVNNKYCYKRFGRQFDGKRQLCASTKASASCQGDTGSGLIWGDVLVGVATSRISCDVPQPAKYLNVAAFVDFIEYYMNGGGFYAKKE